MTYVGYKDKEARKAYLREKMREYRKRNREKLKESQEIHNCLKEHYPYFLKHINQQYCKG